MNGLKFKNKGPSPTGGDSIAIYIYDYIGPEAYGMIGAKSVRDELANYPGADLVTVHINSGGGSIIEALAIYNQLANHKARVEVEIDGLAASSAGWVAMAGDEIRIAENAFVMIHDPSVMVEGGANDLRKEAGTLDRMKDTIVGMFAKRTNVAADKLADMMTAETWLDASEAVELGFATELIESKSYAVNAHVGQYRNAPPAVIAMISEKFDGGTVTKSNLADKETVHAATPSDDELRREVANLLMA